MRTSRIGFLLLVPALTIAACGGDGSLRSLSAPVGVVRVSDGTGVAVLDTTSRRAVTYVPGGVAAGAWVFATTPEATGSSLSAIDGAGQEAWGHHFDQDLTVRVAAADGSLVALLPAGAARVDPYHPTGRRRTTVVVASTEGQADRTYDLEGNFEPEAFTRHGDALFLIEYVPALHPDRYRVRALDLASGEVGGVPSVDGHLQESMRGTARVHAASADGSRLYTLYTTDGADGPRAFVHVLDLDGGWAHCVDLPDALQASPEDELAIAVAPDGHDVTVVAAGSGVAARIDAAALRVTRVATFPPVIEGPGPVVAAASRSGEAYVARGATITVLDDELRPRARWRTASPTGQLVVDPERDRLWQVSQAGAIALDPATGRTLGFIAFPHPVLPEVVADDGTVIQCAC